MEWYHGKKRIQQTRVISKELKLVLYFLPSEHEAPFSPVHVYQNSKLPRIENPKNSPLSPMMLPVLLFPSLLQFHGKSIDLAHPGIPQTLPLSSSPPMSWILHTHIQKAAWEDPGPPQGKVQILCGGREGYRLQDNSSDPSCV